jgi:VIT1/CCC1 family predicted Fe2+/Mn2+ transporter
MQYPTGGPQPILEGTVRIGLVATPGISEAMREELGAGLLQDLFRAFPATHWQVVTLADADVSPPVEASDLIGRARQHLLEHQFHLVVLITDLPLEVGRRPVLSQASRAHGVAVVSLPAHGAVSLKSKTRRSMANAVSTLIGASVMPDPAENSLARRAGVRRRANARIRELGTPISPHPSNVVFLARVILGNLHLLAGMLRANQPWRLTLHLTRSLTAAAATVAAALVTSDIWQIADQMGTARLVFATAAAVVAIAATLIIGAGLWERSPFPRARQQVMLFNTATTATVLLGVFALYVILFILSALGVFVLVPGGLLSTVLHHHASYIDKAQVAWLGSSLATVAGALGAGLETDDAVRRAAYANRGRPRHQQTEGADT